MLTDTACFDQHAHQWWDADGPFRGLHDINPLRLTWMEQSCPLSGQQVADIGCGGGLLAEGMARRGAIVTGIDCSELSLNSARQHLLESGLTVDYLNVPVETLAATHPESFDLVTCMELLEHVSNPSEIIRACARLVKPGGSVCFSSLNRTPQAYALAIVMAEHLLGIVPEGTHQHRQFIKPSELAGMAMACNLEAREIRGLRYNPFTRKCRLSQNTSVNYLMRMVKR